VSESESDRPARASDATPGEMLQDRRERSGLTIERAAQDLHLDTWVIEAIEKNRFSALGAPVFAKGHLRKYAALLGVSQEEILRRYSDVAEDDGDGPTLIPAAHGSIREPARGGSRWLVVVLAILVVGSLAAWWMFAPHLPEIPGVPAEDPVEAPANPADEPASDRVQAE
jgi:cytoskeleton protein RodZ